MVLKELKRAREHAENFDEYKEISLAYDDLAGLNEWKADEKSKFYDYELIKKRIQRLHHCREKQDVHHLMSILQEGLHGNLGNIADPRLYQKTMYGTKHLIEEFLEEVCKALGFIKDYQGEDLCFYEKLAFFQETSQAYGQSALMLSGGAGLGFFHCGVVKALLEQTLLPPVISGSSAGAILAGFIGTLDDEELMEAFSSHSVYEHLRDWVKWQGWFKESLLDGDHLLRQFEAMFGNTTFKEAYLKTGRAINITTSPVDLHQQSRLLNARTSPNALIANAVRASCAVPYLFSPVQLQAKKLDGEIIPYVPNRKFADGSLMDDLPVSRLGRLYGVNHTIVSQTNPLAVPFLSRRAEHNHNLLTRVGGHLTNLVKVNSIFACDVMEHLAFTRNAKLGVHKVRSIIEQTYLGDINILPPRKLSNLLHVMANPNEESIRTFIRIGERVTWPQIARIENNTRISFMFHQCLMDLTKEESRRLMDVEGRQAPSKKEAH